MRFLITFALAVLCTSAASRALPEADSIRALSELGVAGEQDSSRLSARHGGEEHDNPEEHHAQSDVVEHAHISANSSSTPSHKQAAGGHQHAHGPPQAHINETLILMTHDPDPLAYWRYDQEDDGAHPTLLVFHIAFASLSFFALLPISESKPSESYYTRERRLQRAENSSQQPSFSRAGNHRSPSSRNLVSSRPR